VTFLAIERLRQRSPEEWEWHPLRRICALQRVRNRGSSARLLALSSEEGVRFRPDDGGRQPPSEGTVEDYWLVRPGDLVFNPMWAIGRGVAVSDLDGAVSTAYRVYEPRPQLHPRYLHHYMRCDPVVEQYGLVVRGLTTFDRSVTREDLDAMPVPLPPLSTQRRIADVLDAETARLDALIAAKLQMISLSLERHRAFLSSRVALGPEAEARRVLALRTSGPRGWADQLTDGGSPFIRSQNLRRDATTLHTDSVAHVDPPVSNEATRSRTQLGDVVLGITGANTGWVGIVDEQTAGGFVSQHVALVRPSPAVTSDWLAYSYFSHQGQAQLLGGQYGGTKQQLSLEDLARLKLHVPLVEEQARRCAEIKESAARTTQITGTLARQIELLRERRQALITAAVSGELEI
jgi:type I restriction enzyme S subunit